MTFWRSVKPRPVHEVVNLLVFRPLGYTMARMLQPTPIQPPLVVMVHCLLGLVAARWIASGRDWAAALALQVKTVLDNADGQLARLRGQETALGRYLDTEADFVVNAALFHALGRRARAQRQAALAFAVFTLVQSWDFNLEYCYRAIRQERFRPSLPEPSTGIAGALRSLYSTVFAPQDRLIRLLEWRLFTRLTRDVEPSARRALARYWWDRATLAAVVNFGLTTQYCWLGWFLVRRRPAGFLTFTFAQGLYLGLVYLWRILRLMHAIRYQPSRH